MITLRQDKGSALTYEEVDNNFNSMMGGHNFLHVQDQKPQGTPGGSITPNVWIARDLNTVLTNTITGASLDTNQITLPAGKYYVEASAPAIYVDEHQTRIYNATSSNALLVGTSERSAQGTGSTTQSRSFVKGIFDLSETSDVVLHHRCLLAFSTRGLGRECDYTTEVYSDIKIWRIGNYVA